MKHYENCEEKLAQRKAHYEREDVNGRLVINLRDIGHALRGLSEGRGSQQRILIILSETGPITQRELTERLGIQPGSASEVIAKLENAGLVERTVSETDRRTADIALTEEGQRQAEDAKNQRVQLHGQMFSALTDNEKTQLLALLEKVNSDWEARFEERHGHHHGHRPGCDHDCANCPHPCGKRG